MQEVGGSIPPSSTIYPSSNIQGSKKTRRNAGFLFPARPRGDADGNKYCRLAYRFAGKQKVLSLGVYPTVTLALARNGDPNKPELFSRDRAKDLLARGIDPVQFKKAEKLKRYAFAVNNFESVGLEWYAKQRPRWSDVHATKTLWMLEKNLFPGLGSRAVSEITPPELLAALRRIEDRGAYDTAKRAKQVAGQVLRYAVVTGRAEHDPSQDLRGALAASVKTHFSAITDPKKVGPFLSALDGYQGTPVVRAALRLAPLTFVRPCEFRKPHGVISILIPRSGVSLLNK